MKRFKVRLSKKERGFTLIELLIVIAILGVLAAVVVPNVMGLFGRGGNQAYGSDKQTIQTAAATFWGDVHEGPDITTAPAAPTWSDNAANEGTGHWFPTSNGQASGSSTAAIVTDLNVTNGDYGATILYVDNGDGGGTAGNGAAEAGEYATDTEISAAAIWMGLLVNTGVAPSAGGTAVRGTAAPWDTEKDLYLTEFPKSSSNAYNGNPDSVGGTYTWIVADSGRVYGAYRVAADTWYAGFSGNYP